MTVLHSAGAIERKNLNPTPLNSRIIKSSEASESHVKSYDICHEGNWFNKLVACSPLSSPNRAQCQVWFSEKQNVG